MSNENTRFTLMRAGYYELTLIAYLYSVTEGYDYGIKLLKNGVWENYIYRLKPEEDIDTYYFTTCSIMLYSNGNDYFEINCNCYLDQDIFSFAPGQANDMLSIKYFL